MQDGKLKHTPLYDAHLGLKARMVPFAGYEMPVQYTGLLDETKACRTKVGLFDVSHMGQFSLRGKNTLEALSKLVTNDLSRLKLGQAQYNMLCNEQGGVIDDLVIYKRSEEETYICVNASNREKDFEWMTTHLNKSFSFEDQSDETALIAVQGPNAEALVASLGEPNLIRSLKYYWASNSNINNVSCYVSRTGYTGEDGFELYCPAESAEYLWSTLMEKGQSFGITPCGLGSRDTLRLEMGYPLHGHELSEDITPLQANLNWVVKLQKSVPFIGQTALQSEFLTGPKRLLKAFIVQDRRIARQGYKIFDANKNQVGIISSGTHSPHLEAPIALGFVDTSVPANTPVFAEVRESHVPLKEVKLPFVAPKAKKNLLQA